MSIQLEAFWLPPRRPAVEVIVFLHLYAQGAGLSFFERSLRLEAREMHPLCTNPLPRMSPPGK